MSKEIHYNEDGTISSFNDELNEYEATIKELEARNKELESEKVLLNRQIDELEAKINNTELGDRIMKAELAMAKAYAWPNDGDPTKNGEIWLMETGFMKSHLSEEYALSQECIKGVTGQREK